MASARITSTHYQDYQRLGPEWLRWLVSTATLVTVAWTTNDKVPLLVHETHETSQADLQNTTETTQTTQNTTKTRKNTQNQVRPTTFYRYHWLFLPRSPHSPHLVFVTPLLTPP